jgi:hypothetical protein
VTVTEQLDFFGGSTKVGPPPVPPVVFLRSPARRSIQAELDTRCGHCMMNAQAWRDRPASIPQWRRDKDITILKAAYLITQTDGSTLYLCAQHAQEHEERGNHGD